MHTQEGVADKFVADIKATIVEIMKLPDPQDLSKGKVGKTFIY